MRRILPVLIPALLGTTLTATAQMAAPNQAGQPVQVRHTQSAAPFAKSITAKDLKRHLSILASDEYEGRETGEKGQKMAAAYIAKHFKEWGLQAPYPDNADNAYYQKVTLYSTKWTSASLEANGQRLEMLKDFYLSTSKPADAVPDGMTLPLTYGGYGVRTELVDDFQGKDIKDKGVLLLAGEYKNQDGTYAATGTKSPSAFNYDWRKKAAVAKELGIKMLVIATADFDRMLPYVKHLNEKPQMQVNPSGTGNIPVLFVSLETAASLFKTDVATLKAAAVPKAGKDKLLTMTGGDVKDQSVKFTSEKESKTIITENVIGVLPGTDPSGEAVIVTAHYDHIGIIDGKVYNGADDDGSGTVAVMEMAEAFSLAAKKGVRTPRTLVFCLFTGEEKGLLGSEYHSQNPLIPFEKTVANLNIDMIGRRDSAHAKTDDYIYLIGADMISPELHAISEAVNKTTQKLALDYTYNRENDPNRYYYRSDHYNFAKHGVPVIFYFNGTHPDYHGEGDEVQKIIFPKAEKIARLVFYTAWELANRTTPLARKEAVQN